jgi:carbon-monoxide dehydrogenase medium subunit
VASYDVLVDLKGIPALHGISRTAGRVRIGACVTHREIEKSELLRDALPLLPSVEHHVANIRVRNAGTLGGNLCFAEPHSDLTLVTMLLGGRIGVYRSGGPAVLEADTFFSGAYETALAPGDLLTWVEFPVQAKGTVFGYQQFRLHERPSCVVGAVLEPTADGSACAKAAVGEGASGLVPRRSRVAEEFLVNRGWDEIAKYARDVGLMLAEESEPIEDLTGSVEYKRHLIEVLGRRAIEEALRRREAMQP